MSKVHHFVNKDGATFVEINVQILSNNLPFNVKEGQSVQKKNDKELVIFGQEKCIFQSSYFNDRMWYIEGKFSMQSKGMGRGIMVIGFSSRKFGFGLEMDKKI